jgi:hypothetical protein
MSAILPMPARRPRPQTAEDVIRFFFDTSSTARTLLRNGNSFGGYVTALLLITWEPPPNLAPEIVARLDKYRLDCIRDLSSRLDAIAAAAAKRSAELPVSSPEGA